jgi:hypothetical protein
MRVTEKNALVVLLRGHLGESAIQRVVFFESANIPKRPFIYIKKIIKVCPRMWVTHRRAKREECQLRNGEKHSTRCGSGGVNRAA